MSLPGRRALVVISVAGLWLFLRIFARSIDQGVLWILAVLAAAVVFLFRAARRRPIREMPEPPILNSSLRSFETWRSHFLQRLPRPAEALELARSLTHVLVTIYASRKRIAVDYSVWEAFERREIAIPESVYAFLFGQQGSGEKPRRLGPGASRRYSLEFDKALGETLHFLEDFAEVRDEGHVGD